MSIERFSAPQESIQTPQAAKEVIEFVAQQMPRQDPLDFKDVFSAEEITNDLKSLAVLQDRFHNDLLHLTQDEQIRIAFGQRVSRALESTIAFHVPNANWFGDGTEFVRPSEFDDVIHGIDGVVEFQTDGILERLALGVDASRNIQREAISKKVERNVRTLLSQDEAQRREVKYFASNITDERGPLRDIVPVVIGVENKNCDELIQLFATQIRLKSKKQRSLSEQKQLEELSTQLAQHPAQLIFLDQIEMQLKAYDRVLSQEKQDERRARLQTKIAALSLIVAQIRKQRIQLIGASVLQQLDDDPVTRVLRENLSRFVRY